MKLGVNEKEICSQTKTNYKTQIFFEKSFKYHRGKHFKNYWNILDSSDLPSQITEQKHFYEIEPGDNEIFGVLKYMPNNKTPMKDQ